VGGKRCFLGWRQARNGDQRIEGPYLGFQVAGPIRKEDAVDFGGFCQRRKRCGENAMLRRKVVRGSKPVIERIALRQMGKKQGEEA
jgi:hypothetical protein